MKKVSFTKMNGAGNDFIVIDKRNNDDVIPSPDVIKHLTDRKRGIGADGVFFVSPGTSGCDFHVEFYNADGSGGVLCGNGARCAIMFAWQNGYMKNSKTHFLFNDKLYSGEVISDNLVRFDIIDTFDAESSVKPVEFMLDSVPVSGYLLDTGAPHFVIETDGKNFAGYDLNDLPVQSIGRKIRYHDALKPAGANVNFYSISDGRVYLRTYERGVEDETLACGTGSTATAIVSIIKKQMTVPVSIVTHGGDTLTIEMQMDGPLLKNITLCGPAEASFSGTIAL